MKKRRERERVRERDGKDKKKEKELKKGQRGEKVSKTKTADLSRGSFSSRQTTA